jgi:hypothetical protein
MNDAVLTPIDRLIAIEEIRKLKARYFRLMDYREWDGFRRLFAKDAVMDMSAAGSNPDEPDLVSHGADAIVAFIQRVLDGVTTVHHGHMPEIEIESATAATGLWTMEDELWYPETSSWRWAHGYGLYNERYIVEDGEWKIERIELTRITVLNEAR